MKKIKKIGRVTGKCMMAETIIMVFMAIGLAGHIELHGDFPVGAASIAVVAIFVLLGIQILGLQFLLNREEKILVARINRAIRLGQIYAANAAERDLEMLYAFRDSINLFYGV